MTIQNRLRYRFRYLCPGTQLFTLISFFSETHLHEEQEDAAGDEENGNGQRVKVNEQLAIDR